MSKIIIKGFERKRSFQAITIDYIFRSMYNRVYTEGMFFLQSIMYLFMHILTC